MTRVWPLLPILPIWRLPYIVFHCCCSPHVHVSNDELVLYPQEDCSRYDVVSAVSCTLGIQCSILHCISCLFSGLWFIITIPTFGHSFLSIMHVLHLHFCNLNVIHSSRPDPIPFPPGFPQTALCTSNSHSSLSSVNSSCHSYHLSPLLWHPYHLAPTLLT